MDISASVSTVGRTTRRSQLVAATGTDSIGIGVGTTGKGSPDDRTGPRFQPVLSLNSRPHKCTNVDETVRGCVEQKQRTRRQNPDAMLQAAPAMINKTEEM